MEPLTTFRNNSPNLELRAIVSHAKSTGDKVHAGKLLLLSENKGDHFFVLENIPELRPEARRKVWGKNYVS
ncbi:MAG: hypothetical protein KAV41_01095 [Candidatus Pacebacteria bacterium]|nr:hypothetical protein [Candidatus Paceibacterota bacterium]